MRQNCKGNAPFSVPKKASIPQIVPGETVDETAGHPNPRSRIVDGCGVRGPSQLECEFLFKWGLLKSPLRWNTPQRNFRK